MAISRQTVADSILRGISSANDKFEEWTDGAWISEYGVEALMVTCIAEEIRGKQGVCESLLLEAPIDEVMERSGAAKAPGPKKKVLRGKKRADIALFDERGRSIYIIEAKRRWARSVCFKDIEKLLAWTHAGGKAKNGTIKAGFLCMPIVKWAHDRKELNYKIKEQIRIIKDDVDSLFVKGNREVKYWRGSIKDDECEDGIWGFTAICLALSPKV